MKNIKKFLGILFPVTLFGASYIGFILYTIMEGDPTVYGRTPSPLMNLIILAIICTSLLVTYNLYKEDEDMAEEKRQ